jgi:biopolymer transport protein ExbD
VTHDDRLYVGTRSLPRLEDLGAAIRAEQRKSPEKTVFLKGDLRARFGTMRRAMHALREAGITDVVMGTEELQERR